MTHPDTTPSPSPIETVLLRDLVDTSRMSACDTFIFGDFLDLEICEAHAKIMARLRGCYDETSHHPGKERLTAWPSWLPCIAHVKTDTPDSHFLIDPVIQARGGEGLKCDPSVQLHGIVALGKNITIRAGVRIIGECYIGDNAYIGQGCRIKDTVVCAGAKVKFTTSLEDCFIGDGAVIDDLVAVNTRRFEQEASDFGIAVGASATIGVRCTFERNVIIMPGTAIPFATVVRKAGIYHPSH